MFPKPAIEVLRGSARPRPSLEPPLFEALIANLLGTAQLKLFGWVQGGTLDSNGSSFDPCA